MSSHLPIEQTGGWRIVLGETIRVRGPDGEVATPRARKARALLALLACSPQYAASRIDIIRLLWSDRGRPQALASLRQCLFALRAQTPGLVTVDADGVALANCQVDGPPTGQSPAGWLGDLDQIDRAFDRWLADRRAPDKLPLAQGPGAQDTSPPGPRPRRSVWVLGALGVLLLIAGGRLAMRALPIAPAPRPRVIALQAWSVVPADLAMQAQAQRIVATIREGLPTSRLTVRVSEAPDDAARPGRKLDADWLVSGEIRTLTQPAILVARVSTSKGALLWSTRVEAGRDDLAQGADRIALRTAKVVLCAAGGPPVPPRTADVTALLLDVCARIDPTDPSYYIEATVAAARRIASVAPADPYAHALLAMALVVQIPDLPTTLQPAVRAEAGQEATRALAINRTTGEAYLALGKLAHDRASVAEAEVLYRRGLAVEPDHPALPNFMAGVLASVGRNDEALVFARRALALDPASAVKLAAVAEALDRVGRRREATALLDQAERQRGPTPLLIQRRVSMALRGGDPAAARALLQGRADMAGFPEAAQARLIRETYAIQNPDGPQARDLLRELTSQTDNTPGAASRKVLALASLGRTDAALDVAARNRIDTAILFRPGTRGLLMSPRFPQVARRQGLWRYWEATGRWPDICREPGLLWRCGPTVKKASITSG